MILSNSGGIIAVFLLVILPLIVLGVFLFVNFRNKKYTDFVKEHSSAIKTLSQINKSYKFKNIKNFNMTHSYDNENFYSNISPRDYLTYQLVYKQKEVSKAIHDTEDNAKLFEQYSEEIKKNCHFDQYDTLEILKSEKKIKKTERKVFESMIKTPTIEFNITVVLILTNIQGAYRTKKKSKIPASTISLIIKQLNQKNGGYYTNRDIWDAICRVERGKVTNKMRFAIMARDGYRCVKCGRSGRHYDLEIDHIIPIAKGGKSTFDNLQTLCHKCNVRKGANIE